MTEPIRIAISGAAGRIGYALIFRIAAGGIFGRDQPVSLSLLDVPESVPILQANEMELKDSALPLLDGVSINTDPIRAFADADWVILLGGHPLGRKYTDRIDLVRENGPIFVDHGRAINQACPSARVLVVANPCNTNCWIAAQHAHNVPEEHWFAMNRLDRLRATSLVAEKAGVPLGQVNRINVWGNHSASLFIDVHNGFINDQPAHEVITDVNWIRGDLHRIVGHRSQEIASLRGTSPAGTAAQAILGTIRAITTPTPFNRRFGASIFSDGTAYSVPKGIIFGLPLRTEDGVNWSVVHGLYLNDWAQERIAANVAELEHEATVAAELTDNL